MHSLEATKFAAPAHTNFVHKREIVYNFFFFFLQDEVGYKHNVFTALFFMLAVQTSYDSSIHSHSVKYKLQGFTHQQEKFVHMKMLFVTTACCLNVVSILSGIYINFFC